jgi:hypothetical protein
MDEIVSLVMNVLALKIPVFCVKAGWYQKIIVIKLNYLITISVSVDNLKSVAEENCEWCRRN